MSNINLHIPVEFQKMDEFKFDDIRFIPVKIWLMHLGENLNGSYFEKEVVESALPSLKNTPILAYIEKNKENEEDFSDHRIVVECKGDDVRLSYKGQAIGVIPETNNAQFEMRMCEDGIEREFLTCEGLVWTKWDDVNDIFQRDLIKAESMELSDNYTGHFNKDGYFVFDLFEFNGACCLGADVQPAMRNATIEVKFAIADIMKDIEEKLTQFNSMNQPSKEVDIQNTEKEDEMLENMDEKLEAVEDEVVVNSDNVDNSEVDTVENDDEATKIEVSVVEAVEENAIENQDNTDYCVEYEKIKTDYDALMEEVVALREYKDNREKEIRKEQEDCVFEKFEKKLSDVDEFKALKQNSANYTIDQLKKECYAILGMVNDVVNTEIVDTNTTTKFSVVKEKSKDLPYGGLLEKYRIDN